MAFENLIKEKLKNGRLSYTSHIFSLYLWPIFLAKKHKETKLGSGKMSKTQHQRQPNQPLCHPGKKKIDIFFWGSLFFVSVLFILAFIDTPNQPWLTALSLSVYNMVHSIWWGYSDLNREALRHWILNPACLPISPYSRNTHDNDLKVL